MSEVPPEAHRVPKTESFLKNSPLLERSPRDSRLEKFYQFSSDLELREEYSNFFGGLRIGKILEDLDLVAGKVAYSHTQGWERRLGIVTAACDRIDLSGALPNTSDLHLLGRAEFHRNWGKNFIRERKSMETGCKSFFHYGFPS